MCGRYLKTGDILIGDQVLVAAAFGRDYAEFGRLTPIGSALLCAYVLYYTGFMCVCIAIDIRQRLLSSPNQFRTLFETLFRFGAFCCVDS